ncbi:MAG: hypothetical protein ACYC4U_09805 [Pirellulaceae bacterium]
MRKDWFKEELIHSGTGGSTGSVGQSLSNPVYGTDRETLSSESRGDKEVPVTAMSVRYLLTAGLVLSLLCGCRRDPRMQVYIDNVNAEKRMLEDALYDLQYDYESKLEEVDKLRRELGRLKANGSDPGRASAKAKVPSIPGGKLFPDIPELEPPTVEPGIPDREKSTPDKTNVPPQQAPAELEDLEDLEPPKLELPDDPQPESATVEPANPKVADPMAPRGKLAARWTPRSVRRPDPPRRLLNVADNPDTHPAKTDAAGTGNAPGGPGPHASDPPAVSKQAHRPAWRPYR